MVPIKEATGRLYNNLQQNTPKSTKTIKLFDFDFSENKRLITAEHISMQIHQKTKCFLSHVLRGSEDNTIEKTKFREVTM